MIGGCIVDYVYLKKGDIIMPGDEVEVSNSFNDPPRWVRATNEIGSTAPDPSFPAHRIYRRPIKK